MFAIFSHYPTFLVFLAIVAAIVVTMVLMPVWIKFLKSSHIGQQVRADGPQSHLVKQGTPTMGGVIMLIAVIVFTLLASVGAPTAELWLLLGATVATGILGLIDDASKVAHERSLGLTPKAKLIGQFLIAAVFVLVAVNLLGIKPTVEIPFVATLDLGVLTTVVPVGDGIAIPWLYLIYCLILLVGLCNAVNLTDGLDGLAAGTVMVVMLVMAAIAFRAGVLEPALFAGALAVFLSLGRSFLPPFNEGSLTINASTMPGISLEESDKIGSQVESILLEIPEIRTVVRKTGRAELDEHALGVGVSEIEAPYELADRSRSEFMADVRSRLGVLHGVNIEIGQPISHRIDAMLSGTKANIAIKLFGPDLNRLFALGNRIKSSIANIDGIADLNVEQQIERPQLQIRPKREMLARYGITLPAFAEFVEVALGGRVVSQVYDEGRSFDVTVKASDASRNDMERIGELMLDGTDGKVPLSYVADIVSTSGPNAIGRENAQRLIVVSANVADRDLHSVVGDIQEMIREKVDLPEGYHIEYGGQFESEQAASRVLSLMSIISLLIIFLLLFQEFRSLSVSGIIMLNLPLALIGGIVSIWLTSGEVSIPAIIGFISLFGIATRNGILLVSHYNQLRSEGMSLHDSVVNGSLDRLNPILMTALSSALALIPLALGGDLPGNEIQSPMAKVILGGLLSSTLLNGFIVPAVYLIINRKNSNV